jgi:hypothetical protein
MEVENAAMLAAAQEDAEGHARKVALLEGELVEVRQAREVAEEKFHNLSGTSADGARWLVVSEMEHQVQFEEFFLLRTWGAKLCLAIVGLSWVRSHLLVGMWAAALRHAEMVGELTALQLVVSSVVEEVLGRLPNETFRVEVMDELVAKFQRQEELCLRLVGPGARICDLLLRLPASQAQCADHLGEAAGWLEAVLSLVHNITIFIWTKRGHGAHRSRHWLELHHVELLH